MKYSDVGGMDVQKQEIREAVELPLTHFDLYRQIASTRRAATLYGRRHGEAMLNRCAPHDGGVYSRRRFRVRAEVLRRRPGW